MTDTSAFRTVLRGYEPSQVDHAVAELATSVEAARQEAAARTVEVANLHAANTALERSVATHASRIAELEAAQRSAANPTFADLGSRIGSMLTLADEEAAQIRSGAQAAADEHRAQSTKEANATRAAADRYAEDVRTKADAEATKIVEDARRKADAILDDADREASARRGEAEAVYENQRAKAAAAAADFETTLATRRDKAAAEFSAQMDQHQLSLTAVQDRAAALAAESDRAHKDAAATATGLLDQARAEAASLVGAAREQADRIRRDSERELAAVTARRDSITAQLTNVRQMLATLGGGSFIDPLGGHTEAEVAPTVAVAAPEADASTNHEEASTGDDDTEPATEALAVEDADGAALLESAPADAEPVTQKVSR